MTRLRRIAVWGGAIFLTVVFVSVGVRKLVGASAMQWGAKYAVYWELYCNEPKAKLAKGKRPENKDMRGFWLVRPDGSRPPVTDYFIDLWNRQS